MVDQTIQKLVYKLTSMALIVEACYPFHLYIGVGTLSPIFGPSFGFCHTMISKFLFKMGMIAPKHHEDIFT